MGDDGTDGATFVPVDPAFEGSVAPPPWQGGWRSGRLRPSGRRSPSAARLTRAEPVADALGCRGTARRQGASRRRRGRGRPARGQPLVERHLAWAREPSPTNAVNASMPTHAISMGPFSVSRRAGCALARVARGSKVAVGRLARQPADAAGRRSRGAWAARPPSMAGRSLPRRPPAARCGPWPEGVVRLRLGATGRRRPGCGQASTRGEIGRFPGGLAAPTPRASASSRAIP